MSGSVIWSLMCAIISEGLQQNIKSFLPLTHDNKSVTVLLVILLKSRLKLN